MVLKNGAEFAVKYLSGVRGVTNSITLKPQVSRIEVKDKIEDAVKRNAEVDARRISVQAADGKVTLKVMCAPGLKRTKLHCSMCRARRNRSSQSNLGCAVNRQTCGYSLVCNSRLSCAHCLRWGSFCETGLAAFARPGWRGYNEQQLILIESENSQKLWNTRLKVSSTTSIGQEDSVEPSLIQKDSER